jgi:hypothetical protein
VLQEDERVLERMQAVEGVFVRLSWKTVQKNAGVKTGSVGWHRSGPFLASAKWTAEKMRRSCRGPLLVAAGSFAATFAAPSYARLDAPPGRGGGDEWVPMRSEWEALQVPHPAWDAHGGRFYLRPDPSYAGASRSYSDGPSLRAMTNKYFQWAREEGGEEEPWPWVWAQKPSIGSVVVVVVGGSVSDGAAALTRVCATREPLLTTVIAVGDAAALARHGVGDPGSATEKIAVIDAAVHKVDHEAKIVLTTPRSATRRPLSDWHADERLLFYDELVCV